MEFFCNVAPYILVAPVPVFFLGFVMVIHSRKAKSIKLSGEFGSYEVDYYEVTHQRLNRYGTFLSLGIIPFGILAVIFVLITMITGIINYAQGG